MLEPTMEQGLSCPMERRQQPCSLLGERPSTRQEKDPAFHPAMSKEEELSVHVTDFCVKSLRYETCMPLLSVISYH
jgi:hypothetical protein